MLEVVSLVGSSGSGKSSISSALSERLDDNHIDSVVISKDQVRADIGRERYGVDDHSKGYSIPRAIIGQSIDVRDLRIEMNRRVRAALEIGKLVILEGGTRTRGALAETLQCVDISDGQLGIYLLTVPTTVAVKRLRQRRRDGYRYDDQLVIQAAKLTGQWLGLRAHDAVHPNDSDVQILDALRPVADSVEFIARDVLLSRRSSRDLVS